FAAIAKEARVPFQVLILDTPPEVAYERNRKRMACVSDEIFERFLNGSVVERDGQKVQSTPGFQTESQFPFVRVNSEDKIVIRPACTLEESNWDIVGDVHGMLDDLKTLLERMDYSADENGVYRHAQGRRLLFLGDLVDRGPQSLETLGFVKKLCDQGVAISLLGNHEVKLLNFWEQAKAGTLKEWNSFASAQTGCELLKMPTDKAVELME